MRTRSLGLWVVIAILLLSGARTAAQRPPLTDADRQQLLNYPLTLPKANALLDAIREMTAYLAARPDLAEVMARSMKMNSAEQIAQMERDPKAMAIAKQHGLSATDYVYGGSALRMAFLSAQGLNGPTIIASPANTAFAKANLAELKAKIEAVDAVGARGRGAR